MSRVWIAVAVALVAFLIAVWWQMDVWDDGIPPRHHHSESEYAAVLPQSAAEGRA